jgi:4-diphosphocytidyl-2-C-methyl-D-erythritol kinase
MDSLQIKAPAKINLLLKIEGRRDDGYHLLSMLNAMLTLHDEIILTRKKASDGVLLQPAGGYWNNIDSNPQFNLAGRAALRFMAEFDLDLGLKIELTKNIPSGSGLGGGSSDAAAVLRGMRVLFGPELRAKEFTPQEISEKCNLIALSLGADVPFFLGQSPLAFVEGIGEILTPLAPLKWLNKRECLLIFPPFSVPTPAVFSELRATRNLHSFKSDKSFRDALKGAFVSSTNSFEHFAHYMTNDLSEIVCRMHPELKTLLLELQEIDGLVCSISGSGSAIYVLPIFEEFFDMSRISRVEQIAGRHFATFVRTNFLAIL